MGISLSSFIPYGSTNRAFAFRIYSSSMFWNVSSAAFVTTKNIRFFASSDKDLKTSLTKSLTLLSSMLSVPLCKKIIASTLLQPYSFWAVKNSIVSISIPPTASTPGVSTMRQPSHSSCKGYFMVTSLVIFDFGWLSMYCSRSCLFISLRDVASRPFTIFGSHILDLFQPFMINLLMSLTGRELYWSSIATSFPNFPDMLPFMVSLCPSP